MIPPTKAQHDAVVAAKGRSYTEPPMRHARQHDDDNTDSGPSMVDRVIADTRRTPTP